MNLILILLLAVWAILLFGGFFLGKEDRYQSIPTLNRMASSATLVILSWSLLWFAPIESGWFTWLIALGMTLGFIGDLFMAELIIKGENHILAGMGAFGLGHIVYITGCIGYANAVGLNRPIFWACGIGVWLLIGLIGWWLTVWRPSNPDNRSLLHWGALPYAELLAGTTGVGTALALHDGRFTLFAVGAALFLFSDLLIALNLFNDIKLRQHHDLVWLTYGPGQCLIVMSSFIIR